MHFSFWKLRELTKSGTNGAIKAPIRATVDAAPTPIDRIIVGNISDVWTYDVENADVMPILPSRNNVTTAQVFSAPRNDSNNNKFMENNEKIRSVLNMWHNWIFHVYGTYRAVWIHQRHRWKRTAVMNRPMPTVFQFYSLQSKIVCNQEFQL